MISIDWTLKIRNRTISFLIILLVTQLSCTTNSSKFDKYNINVNEDESITFIGKLNSSITEFEFIFDKFMNNKSSVEDEIIIGLEINNNVKMGYAKEVKKILRKYHSKLKVAYHDNNEGEILVKLPPNSTEKIQWDKLRKRNVFHVNIVANDSLLVNDKLCTLDELSKKVKIFLKSDPKNSNLPQLSLKNIPGLGEVYSAKKSVIVLENQYDVSYKSYIQIYETIRSEYKSVWDSYSLKYFNTPNFDDLKNENKLIVKEILPYVLGEI